MKINIPGQELLELKNVVFDYNGTLAIDGKLINGVSQNINDLSDRLKFYVITADTYGSVQKQLEDTNCEVIIIPKSQQDISKLNFVKELGATMTLSAGNGRNDHLMLKETIVGIGILQDEGICTATLMNSDIVCKSIEDVFGYLKNPNRLIATLRN